MKIVKMDFKVLSSSGYDERHPPSELLVDKHTPMAIGWQSERFCLFPQELVLHLTAGVCRIRKIQLLAHHFKIPTRVEVHLATVPQAAAWAGFGPGSLSSVKFQRIGFVSLNDNVANSYRARELKTIHLDAEVNLVKLVLHKCHVNALNLYNQIGLVAINVLGAVSESDASLQSISHYTLDSHRPAYGEISKAVLRGIMDKSLVDSLTPQDQDLSVSVEYDLHISNAISAIQRAKEKAVQEEDYSVARIMKQLRTLFLQGGDEIARLNLKKQETVSAEDFESAERYQFKINGLKNTLRSQMAESGYVIVKGELVRVKNSDEVLLKEKLPSSPTFSKLNHTLQQRESCINDHILPQQNSVSSTQSVNQYFRKRNSTSELDLGRNFDDKNAPQHSTCLHVPPKSPPLPALEKSLLRKRPQSDVLATSISPQISKNFQERDMSGDFHELDEATNAYHGRSNSVQPVFALAVNEFGETLVSLVLGRQFRHREAGLNNLMLEISQLDATGAMAMKFVKAALQLLTETLSDIRERTSILTLSAFNLLIEKATQQNVDPCAIVSVLEEGLFTLLLFRAGDLNARVKKGCLDTIRRCIKAYHTVEQPNGGRASIIPALVNSSAINRPLSVVHHRHIRTRLDVLIEVIQTYGVDDATIRLSSHFNIGLTSKEVIQFTAPFLEHVNNDVRDAAFSVVTILSQLVGNEHVFKNLKGLKEPQLQLVKARMDATRRRKKELNYNDDITDVLEQHAGTLDTDSLNSIQTDKDRKQIKEVEKCLEKQSDSADDTALKYIAFDKRCIFCGDHSSSYTEETLELHYWEACPLLTKCPNCGLITEVTALTRHLLKDCDDAATMRLCSRCNEAVHKKEFKAHTSQKRCTASKPGKCRCPLCHVDFSGPAALRIHLTAGQGCSASNRRPTV
ncbi:hypothetical protein BASA50_003697 [Batrachochytrium salamandrivorans]|uniref:TOG domain-containing protein n=1 Tax=Batrachochytrium salamandrivorans TaxID=1357716 RepID=A0ABQ8FL43_9FUNG|nr:hypothetical protein BASA50_003697 [Batrachochytrium salamandrivorans]